MNNSYNILGKPEFDRQGVQSAYYTSKRHNKIRLRKTFLELNGAQSTLLPPLPREGEKTQKPYFSNGGLKVPSPSLGKKVEINRVTNKPKE